MEINESLSLETFPKSYEACFLESCSVKENGLHHLYFKLQPSTNTWGGAIYPSSLLPENLVNGCCKNFQEKKLMGLPEFGVMVLYFSGFLVYKKYCKPLNISFLWCVQPM